MTENRVGDWLLTHTGVQFWPLDPRPEEINIEDIAHALSLQCRFSGHCKYHYSVAQHSVMVSLHATRENAAVRKYLPEITEAKGKDTKARKIQVIVAFLSGDINHLMSKASMFGFGLNLQRCHNMAFVGLSYSFEQLFQAIRRCWRFGQIHAVDAHMVIAETEGPVLAAIKRKESQYEELQAEMNAAMREEQLLARHIVTRYDHEMKMKVPDWITTQS